MSSQDLEAKEANPTAVREPEEAPPAPAKPNPAGEIPNGGLTAWLQVLGSFLLFLNSWSVICVFFLSSLRLLTGK